MRKKQKARYMHGQKLKKVKEKARAAAQMGVSPHSLKKSFTLQGKASNVLSACMKSK